MHSKMHQGWRSKTPDLFRFLESSRSDFLYNCAGNAINITEDADVVVACCMHTCEVADVWWRQPAEVGEGRCQRPRQRSSHWSNSTSVVLSWTWARRAVSAVHAAGVPR